VACVLSGTVPTLCGVWSGEVTVMGHEVTSGPPSLVVGALWLSSNITPGRAQRTRRDRHVSFVTWQVHALKHDNITPMITSLRRLSLCKGARIGRPGTIGKIVGNIATRWQQLCRPGPSNYCKSLKWIHGVDIMGEHWTVTFKWDAHDWDASFKDPFVDTLKMQIMTAFVADW